MYEGTIKKINLQHAIHAIVHRLRITEQKTTNITPFDAHFGRKCITPASNIATKSNTKNLKCNRKFNYYLDEETIPGRSFSTDEQWADKGMC